MSIVFFSGDEVKSGHFRIEATLHFCFIRLLCHCPSVFHTLFSVITLYWLNPPGSVLISICLSVPSLSSFCPLFLCSVRESMQIFLLFLMGSVISIKGEKKQGVLKTDFLCLAIAIARQDFGSGSFLST